MTHVARALAAVALVAAVACKGRDAAPADAGTETGATGTATVPDTAVSKELKVAGVMIGKKLGENKLVSEPTFQFAPTDTVYVSISTEGQPDSAQLTAIWRSQKGVVDSSTQTIRPAGEENTEFHVSNPEGWPAGTYNVTIYANGDSVEAKNFAVKK